jgi:hypothetical protein
MGTRCQLPQILCFLVTKIKNFSSLFQTKRRQILLRKIIWQEYFSKIHPLPSITNQFIMSVECPRLIRRHTSSKSSLKTMIGLWALLSLVLMGNQYGNLNIFSHFKSLKRKKKLWNHLYRQKCKLPLVKIMTLKFRNNSSHDPSQITLKNYLFKNKPNSKLKKNSMHISPLLNQQL